MGWGSGGDLAESIWGKVSPYLPDEVKVELAVEICVEFAKLDCDTLRECYDLWHHAIRNPQFLARSLSYESCQTKEELIDVLAEYYPKMKVSLDFIEEVWDYYKKDNGL